MGAERAHIVDAVAFGKLIPLTAEQMKTFYTFKGVIGSLPKPKPLTKHERKKLKRDSRPVRPHRNSR